MGQRERRERRMANAREVAERAEQESVWKPASFRVPEGMELWKWEGGKTYKLDVIPFTLDKPKPDGPKRYGGLETGDTHYEWTYSAHGDLGPRGDRHCCLWKTFGEDCPVCELRIKLYQSPDTKEDAKNFGERTRQLFYVRDRENKAGGVCLLEASPVMGKAPGFGQMIQNKIKKHAKLATFADPEDGYYLEVMCEEDSYNGKKFGKPVDVEFVKRSKPIPEAVYADLPPLDTLLIKTSYKELKRLLHQKDEDDDPDSGDNKTDVDDEDEHDPNSINKGDKVSFVYKGKKLKGVVGKLKDGDNGPMAAIKVGDKLHWIDCDELVPLDGVDGDDEEADF